MKKWLIVVPWFLWSIVEGSPHATVIHEYQSKALCFTFAKVYAREYAKIVPSAELLPDEFRARVLVAEKLSENISKGKANFICSPVNPQP